MAVIKDKKISAGPGGNVNERGNIVFTGYWSFKKDDVEPEVTYIDIPVTKKWDDMQPTADRKAVINLPSTVHLSMPHVYASQIEYFHKNLKYRENVVISLHPHNDRGTAISDAELGLLAGADRIEGTLFGNGERTGNVDIITLGMNLYTHGVDPELDFSDMPELCARFEEFTDLPISPRQPYCGSLVFAAFSGSHQDAIAKGMQFRVDHDVDTWTVPYLPLDPTDIGRNYDADVIRINSQSGKGGVGYILERNFGLYLPPKLREHMGYTAKSVSDHLHKELKPDEIFELYRSTYEGKTSPFNVVDVHFKRPDKERFEATITTTFNGGPETETVAVGNGRLNSVVNAIKKATGLNFTLTSYTEHALSKSSSARAIAYVGIEIEGKETSWGSGLNHDIIQASIVAVVNAINNGLTQ